jgi:hypothetical protein
MYQQSLCGSMSVKSLRRRNAMAENGGNVSATGQVHIFNTSNVPITLTLNGNQLSVLSEDAGQGSNYAPSSMAVPRSDATKISDPVFAEQNTLAVKFPGTTNNYPSVDISPMQFPTNRDLLLYIFYGYMVLVDASTSMMIINQAPA